MLEFFRKNQKVFFIFVTAIIVISFTFFGAVNTFAPKEEMANRLVGKALDGSKLMEKEVTALAHIHREGEQPHLLSDGWVQQQWLLTDLAETLALTYFDELKEELAERINKVRHFRPYVHPGAAFLSGPAVWEQFAPEINQVLAEIKAAGEQINKAQVSQLFALYRAQASFPSHLLHQMLFYQQAQYKWLKQDPALPRADLAVAGFHSVEEWFGPKFASALSQAILNGATMAEMRGYAVAKEDARKELFLNVYRNLRTYGQQENPPTMEEAQAYYQNMVRSLGIGESGAVRLWSRVMLCRLLFQEVGQATFVDSLAAEQFYKMARRTALVESYTIDPGLTLATFNDLLKFETYLEQVSDKSSTLDIPAGRRSPEIVIQSHPELVSKSYRVKWKEINQSNLASKISLKETWEWQLDEAHFRLIGETFAPWGGKTFESREQRFEALEKLDAATRLKVDNFARMEMVKAHPEWIDQALAKEPFFEKTIDLRLSGKAAPFHGEISAIEACALLDEGDHHRLQWGEEYVYLLEVEERLGANVISFEEANRSGSLDIMVEQWLSAAYPEIAAEKWVDEEGNVPPFEEKREELASLLFTDLLRALDKGTPFDNVDLYAEKRFESHIKRAYQSAKKGEPLPWGVISQEVTLKQDDSEAERAFQLQEGDWSELSGNSFFHLLSFEEGNYEQEDLQAIKEPLVREAQKELMIELLNAILEKQAISFLSDD